MQRRSYDLRLEGTLITMPTVENHSNGKDIVICRKSTQENAVEFYRVYLKHDDVNMIVNYGYPGMSVIVYGTLRADREIQIMADEIVFVSFSCFKQVSKKPEKTVQKTQNIHWH